MPNSFLGRDKEGTGYWLSSPSFDCDWYVGFGYIGNNHLHTHLDSVLNETGKDWHSAMKEFFGDELTNKLSKDADLWKFCDLMKSFYTLKDAYELYHSGSSHLTTVKSPNFKNEEMAVHIMKDIFKTVNEVSKMLKMTPLKWSKKIENKVRYAVNPTTFVRNENKNSDKTWFMVYYNPLDEKTLRAHSKDTMIPSEIWEQNRK